MSEPTNPARTHAVVVGIEQYRLEDRLIGPALDAARFAVWLRKNGVRQDNIRLFLSPLPENQPEVDRLLQSPDVGVAYAPGNSTPIEECLEGLSDRKGDVLYLYWVGHGIADTAGNRYLIYSDTTEKTLHRHLDVHSWLKRLRSYGNLRTQIAYIDACAILKRWDLGRHQVQAGVPSAAQSIFFAASVGERAANDEVKRSAHFSSALREVIDTVLNATDGRWPPDPAQVIRLLRERFRANRTQRPAYYQAGNVEGDLVEDGKLPECGYVQYVAWKYGYSLNELAAWADSFGTTGELSGLETRKSALRLLERESGMAAGALSVPLSNVSEDWERTLAVAIDRQVLKPLLDFVQKKHYYSCHIVTEIQARSALNDLRRLLEDPSIPERDVQDAFMHVCAPLKLRDSPQSRGEMLERLVPTVKDTLQHAAELALRIYAVCPKEPLKGWANVHLSPDALAHIEGRLRKEREDPTHHLFFHVDRQRLSATLYRGREFALVKDWPAVPFQQQDAGALVDPYLAEVESRSENLMIHFLVSQEYFSWSPQAVLVEAAGERVPLASLYPTVMGWLDRALGRKRTRRSDWDARSQRVFEVQSGGGISVAWIAKNATEGEIEAALSPESTHHVVAFDFPTSRQSVSQSCPITAAVRRGVPVMLWPCAEPLDPGAVRAAVSKHVKGGALEQLLRQMKAFYDRDLHRPWRMALFWDDPKKKPPKFVYREVE